jgi:tRNA (adenine57-N1/adenine58-N1)-methyltransferase
VLELLMRYFKTDPDRIRPDDTMTAHTGFLIFGAKVRPVPVASLPEKLSDDDASPDAASTCGDV